MPTAHEIHKDQLAKLRVAAIGAMEDMIADPKVSPKAKAEMAELYERATGKKPH